MSFINCTINGFTILHKLGEGGMAEVYYAENKLSKKAAIKILKLLHCNNNEIVTRFENEAKIMLKLDHPNIRQVYDYTTLNGRPIIIMEYLDGNDISSFIKQNNFIKDAIVQAWWNQMVDALNYTHSKGIIHRDIKPSNMFLTKDGQIKLLDFGIAKSGVDSNLTQQFGTEMGTPMYMSPEQVKDIKGLSHKSDYYSLAVSFYYILTKNTPYDSTQLSEFEIKKNIVENILNLNNLPKHWSQFLKGYLSKNPADRKNLRYFEYEKQLDKTKKPVLWIVLSCFFLIALIAVSILFYLNNEYQESLISSKNYEIKELEDDIESSYSLYSNMIDELEKENEMLNNQLDKIIKKFPIIIKSIDFENVNYSGDKLYNTLSGNNFYKSDVYFIQPNIKYDSNLAISKTISLKIRIIDPDNEIKCTYYYDFYANGSYDENISSNISGYGSKSGRYYDYGTHTVEIWYSGVCIGTGTFTIKY